MRLAIVLTALLWAAAPASAQTISVSGEGTLTTITADGLEVRTVLEAASFALNVPRDFEGLTLGEGCRFTGVPAFNPIGANFRYGCQAGPNFRLTLGSGNDIVLKRNQGAHEPFDVTASLGGGLGHADVRGPGGPRARHGRRRQRPRRHQLRALHLPRRRHGRPRQRVRGARRLARAGHADRARPRARPPTSRSSRAAPATTPSRPSTASRERVFCGPGSDHAIAEAGDTVSSDCERVDLFAGAPVIGSGPSGDRRELERAVRVRARGREPAAGALRVRAGRRGVHAVRVAGRAERAGRG